jgi:hypothetical protein
MSAIDPVRFSGTVRYWSPEKEAGLAVVDVPDALVPALGGLRQQRVHGSIAGAAFTSNVMPAGSGRLALTVSKAMLRSANRNIGESVEVEITAVGRD